MRQYGFEYAEQTIKNAKALAQNLDQKGIKVEGKEFGFTESHQVAVDVSAVGGGKEAAAKLEENDIILNFNMLPHDKDPKNPRGLRIGVQEMTRFGMKESEMEVIADFISKILIERQSLKNEVNQFRKKYIRMEYC
jgi:glycine hydroxymethyltransferase